ncbi:MAG: peptidylprolyl isomerase [Melioribacteraceae bacterium]|nr:peptidylprolyl isomerase [Melioribacteraceae bacterium]
MKWTKKICSKFSILFVLLTLTNLNAKGNFDKNTILASVGKKNITVGNFLTRYSDYIFSSGIKDNIVTRRSILNNMINEILLYHYDDNSNIFNNPEYKKELEWARKQTILAFLKDQEIFAKLTATESELRDAFFKTNMKVSARHLFAETEEEAENLYQLLQTGADFNQLAKQVFTDSTLQNNGGYLGFFTWGDMDPNFEDAAFKLNEGEISKPIKTKYGFSIIKVEKKIANPIITEDEFLRKKKHVERIVKMRKISSEEEKFINKIFDSNKLKINDSAINYIFENLSSINQIEKNNPPEFLYVVKYGNKNYSLNEVLQKINELPPFHRRKLNSVQNIKAIIKGFVLQDILLSMAIKKSYDKNPEVQKVISNYFDNIFLRYKREEVANAKVFPDSLIYKFYVDNPQYFMNENQINVQEIILDNKELADSLINEIKKGTNFGLLAKKFSLREWSAKNNGEIGLSDISKFGGIKDTLWKSETGNVVGPIKIQEMFGIFKILDKKNGDVKDFTEVKNLAHRLLKKEKSKPIMEEYIEKLRRKTTVVWDDKLLGSLELQKN